MGILPFDISRLPEFEKLGHENTHAVQKRVHRNLFNTGTWNTIGRIKINS